ncbi:MAG: long-chain fatty acid--CoA ligase [Gemmatimonadaceae bacterium]|nr:long-chain fatty acid--CoA ligase [Gemmatimonadaceae bacterium]
MSGGPRPARGTLNELFFSAIERHRLAAMYQVKQGGKWRAISHEEVLDRVRRVSLALPGLGLEPGDRVAILSENRPEWAFVDWACLTGRIIDVPIYPSLPAEQITHLLADSGTKVVFVSNPDQAAKIAAIRGEVPAVSHVVTFDTAVGAGADLTFAELERRGKAADGADAAAKWRAAALTVQPDDMATIIYTSGTTGLPKGVMLTHDNFFSNVGAGASCIPFDGTDVALSFLPLTHVFERMGDYLFVATGTSIAYAESFDAVPLNLSEVRPTIAFSVPRLYEKMYARVLENALAGGGLRKRIFFWARGVADRWATARLAGRSPSLLTSIAYRIAQRLVFSKLRARVGGRLRFFVSGGAPLSPDINRFFYSAGLVILEGYGLTETSPVICVNTPAAFRIGTVGKPVPGVEVAIAGDGEILTRGPHVTKGYFNNPGATAEAIDADGWFRTGDIGVIEDGYLRITDRKKDLIKTAGGKYVAPQPIENAVRTNKYVSQAVVVGDKRKFPAILVVPNWDQLEKWAARHNIIWTDRAQLLQMPTIHAKMEKEVTKHFAGLASFETPKKIALLEHDFSIERGELTPTLKVKRRVIEDAYEKVIDGLYVEDPGARSATH